jgi:hypothetical protein
VGERLYLALFVERAESESGDEGPVPFVQKTGRLGNPFGDRPPRLEDDIGYYGSGREASEAFPFPPCRDAAAPRQRHRLPDLGHRLYPDRLAR